MKVKITFMPDDRTIEVRPGSTVLDASRRARVTIRTRCGGNASCLMCKVRCDQSEALSKPKEQEIRKLGSLLDQGYRLGCQAVVSEACTIHLPEDPLKAAVRAQLLKQQELEDDLI